MSNPSVCAVMLTADRPELTRQAVECFRRQTYDPICRTLLIFDSGNDTDWYDSRCDFENEFHAIKIALDALAFLVVLKPNNRATDATFRVSGWSRT